MVRATYRVTFIDKDGAENQKLLETDCFKDVLDFMMEYEIVKIKLVK